VGVLTKKNVLKTLRLAHKYDIRTLRSACAAVLQKALPDLELLPTEIEPLSVMSGVVHLQNLGESGSLFESYLKQMNHFIPTSFSRKCFQSTALGTSHTKALVHPLFSQLNKATLQQVIRIFHPVLGALLLAE
jgi:hypothetical protein